jgi:hypothetical protein
MTALGGELANQGDVRNYNTYPFKSGSFYSSVGATNAPVAGQSFAGICYLFNYDPANYAVIEARSQNDGNVPGKMYVRQKIAGTWGPWTWDEQAAEDFANTKVSRSGDTMTGALHMVMTTPALVMVYGTQAEIISRNGIDTVSANRWIISPGDTAPEGGGNTGSNFAIGRCADSDGSLIDNPIYIARGDGRVIGNGAAPVNGNDFANKGYVDTKVAAGVAGVDLTSRVAKVGDTMTGALNIAATGTSWATLNLYSASGGRSNIIGLKSSLPRWEMNLGDGGAEAAGNVGSDFALYRYDNTGAYIGTAFTVNRATGNATFSGQATCGNLLANNANISIRSLAGGNAVLALQDEAATARGTLYWDRAGGFLSLINAGGFSLLLIDNGTVRTGLGVEGRAGSPGGPDGIPHNFYWTGSVNQMWVGTTNLGAVAVTCDYRIKKDVVPLASTWEAVRALKPIEYTQAEFTPPVEKLARVQEAQRAEKENRPSPDKQGPLFAADDIKRWGFLAHELQETLLPSAAHGEKDSPNQVQSPNLMAICAALTRALQEAMARIEALEAA